MESHLYSDMLGQFTSQFQLAPDLPESKSCLIWGLSVLTVNFFEIFVGATHSSCSYYKFKIKN